MKENTLETLSKASPKPEMVSGREISCPKFFFLVCPGKGYVQRRIEQGVFGENQRAPSWEKRTHPNPLEENPMGKELGTSPSPHPHHTPPARPQ